MENVVAHLIYISQTSNSTLTYLNFENITTYYEALYINENNFNLTISDFNVSNNKLYSMSYDLPSGAFVSIVKNNIQLIISYGIFYNLRNYHYSIEI